MSDRAGTGDDDGPGDGDPEAPPGEPDAGEGPDGVAGGGPADGPTDGRARVRELLAELQDRPLHGGPDGPGARLAEIEDIADASFSEPTAERVRFGCQQVRSHLGEDPAVATEYVRAMERLLSS